MMELFVDFNNRPIVFIRFNPDSYILNNSNKVKSCFKLTQTNGVQIDETSNWPHRTNILKNVINKYLVKIPEKDVTIEKLFYDT
jgi:hypothetical protein